MGKITSSRARARELLNNELADGGTMKTKIVVAAFFFLLVSITHCLAEDLIVFNSWSKDGFIFENHIAYSRLMKMPDWSPVHGQPPISQVKAIEIASKYLKKSDPTFTNAKISSIQLTQFLIPNYFKDKWYYNIIFMTNIPVRNVAPDNATVVIFMDGSIADVSKKKLEVDKSVLKRVRDNLDKKLKQ